jgi:hypothetical protein
MLLRRAIKPREEVTGLVSLLTYECCNDILLKAQTIYKAVCSVYVIQSPGLVIQTASVLGLASNEQNMI